MLLSFFFLYLLALFFLIGLPFGPLLKSLRLDLSFGALSCVGITVVSIFVTIGYKLGMTVETITWFVNVLAVLSLFLAALRLFRKKGRLAICIEWSLAFSVLVAILMLAPALVGGLRFSIFEGNHWDSYNYLESALTYQRVPYQTLISNSDQQLINADLFPFARTNLFLRPEVSIVYGTLVNVFPGQGLFVHYGLLVYFQFLTFCVVSLLSRELVPQKFIPPELLSFAIVGGFWGQYIVDMNAWSQAAAMPLLLVGVLFFIRTFDRLDRSGKRYLTWTEISVFALNCIGAFYLYPEGAIFFFPAYSIVLLFGIYRWRPRIPVLVCTVVLAGCAALVLSVRENNLLFAANQMQFAVRGNVSWWRHFQAFIFGNAGMSKHIFSNLVDGLAGVFGCYLITPGSGYHGLIVLIYRIFLLAALLILFVGSILGFRTLPRPARNILFLSVLVMACEAIVFLCLRQYWTAGKALSFFAYLLLLVVLEPALTVDPYRSRVQLGAALVAWIIVAGQIAFTMYRPLAASLPYGIHYSMPYPSIQDVELKKDIDFGDLNFLKKIKKRDRVAVDVSDIWAQLFLRLLLLSKNIDFSMNAPVVVTVDPLVVVPVTSPCTDCTCRLFLVPDNRKGYRQTVQVEQIKK